MKEDASPYTKRARTTSTNPPCCPRWGSAALFNNNQYVGLAIPLSMLMAILVWVVLEKTKFGYELKATGYNKNAAKYCGMAEKRNVILTPDHRRRARRHGRGAATTSPATSSGSATDLAPSPRMGFNGIAARLPRRTEPHRHRARLVLHPAHHGRRRVCG